ncbi:unnamed protein product [Brassicogethes aeneus]|uniref:Uncharacterized protein n=1 Tax=Brassicogethes aeneus TaxID=1431903 RepID=A0A9P0BE07_BRAAE|nr:unnamed protein product [Brassicogethes aeneus]
MDFFGLTGMGASSPIRDTMRPDYQEPSVKPDLAETLKKANEEGKPLSEVVREADVYIGFVDGFSYGSYDRLTQMRSKAILKPVGPQEMHAIPATESMKFGWWYNDCKLPKYESEPNWYKRETQFALNSSDMTKFASIKRL